MTTTSRLSVLEDALEDLLVADAILGALSPPPHVAEPQAPAREEVWIAENAEEDQETSLTGAPNQERRAVLTLRVCVFVAKLTSGPGSTEVVRDYRAVRDRSDQLTAAVETIVRQNDQLGLTQDDCYRAEVAKIERQNGAWESTRGLLRVVHVDCVSYLSP